jgi:hypothetical protein
MPKSGTWVEFKQSVEELSPITTLLDLAMIFGWLGWVKALLGGLQWWHYAFFIGMFGLLTLDAKWRLKKEGFSKAAQRAFEQKQKEDMQAENQSLRIMVEQMIKQGKRKGVKFNYKPKKSKMPAQVEIRTSQDWLKFKEIYGKL